MSPTSSALIQAFTDEGARDVVNVRSNGTVVFRSADTSRVITGVLARLRESTGYSAPAVVRSADEILGMAGALDPDRPGGEVAFFDATDLPPLDLPWTETGRGHLTVHVLTPGYAVTSWSSSASGSNAATVLGSMLGVPVTCRAVSTVRRVADLVVAGL